MADDQVLHRLLHHHCTRWLTKHGDGLFSLVLGHSRRSCLLNPKAKERKVIPPPLARLRRLEKRSSAMSLWEDQGVRETSEASDELAHVVALLVRRGS
ncbi:hypothetical protein CXB51_025976 [Gossypium anomalum]|uniref:Uncharacterized protein n=1 Tax=Gossypium anomalum TaxID=47600 RepID=A0A8J6CV90_9ROSI|nr:hypothetical protein CXB51_025976 [Gossypium anomalum]